MASPAELDPLRLLESALGVLWLLVVVVVVVRRVVVEEACHSRT